MARDDTGWPLPGYPRPARTRATLLVSGLAAALCAGSLLAGATASASVRPARLALPAGFVVDADPPTPGGTDGDPPPTESAEPTDTADPPQTPGSPAPPTETTPTTNPTASAPAPTTPAPPASGAPTTPPVQPTPPGTPGQPGPQQPGQPHRGVYVTTDDVTLPESYWSDDDTMADLRITIANTGEVDELVQLAYALPEGVTDAGTRGCEAGPTGGRCTAWTVAAGARFRTHLRLRVDGDAWRTMPLSGSVQVTASRPNAPTVTDNQGFAVLFPAGPPDPGVSLSAGEVSFDITGQATTLDVRLGNTGRVDTTGTVEVVLPTGVTVPSMPPGCVAEAPDRTRCDLGAIVAGQVGTARLPVAATPEAQRTAPLSGAVIGTLAPRAGKARTIQLSFRIVAVAALATPVVSAAPTGSQGALPPLAGAGRETGMTRVQKLALVLIGASMLLVVLALALATGTLRRRMDDQRRPPVVDAGGAVD